MIRDLKPYPAYKDSGVPWLGKVPAHWEVRRLGQIGRLSKGNGGSKEDEASTGVPCVRYGDLYTTHTYFIEKSKSFVSPERAKDYTSISAGEVLFAASGETIAEIGKSAVNLIEGEACCGGDVILFRPRREIDSRYIGYATDCQPAAAQKASMGRGITVKHIYADQLKYLSVVLAPLPEQAAIVRFLDHTNRRIQRYIRAKKKLIALLNEQRQAIIHRAVTRGLDPNVRLKPSGVEWLGEVPEHWEVRRSKRLFNPRGELARPNDPQLSATQAYGVIPQDEYERRVGRKIVKIFRHLEKRRHVEVGDFVISMRSFQGGLERAWAAGCIRSSYIVLQPTERIDVDFFGYVFKSPGYIGALQATANFIRDGQDLNFENFCAVDLVVPPLEEQRFIARSVMESIASTAEAAETARKEIDLLAEYRSRLIADIVTGKLDVREVAVRLPKEVDEAEPIAEEETIEEGDEVDEDADLDADSEEAGA